MTFLAHVVFKDEFVMITTDTRCNMMLFNPSTGESVTDRTINKSINDKGSMLTGKVLASVGGLMRPGQEVVELLKGKIQPDYDLDDIKPILEEVLTQYIKEREGSFDQKLWEKPDTTFVIHLAGFYKDDSTGVLTASGSGKIEESYKVTPEGTPLFFWLFSPTPEIYDMQLRFFDPDFVGQSATGEMRGTMTNHLATIHAIVSHVQPEEVSSNCIFHILEREGDKFIYKTFEYETKEYQNSLPSVEDLRRAFISPKTDE